MRRRSLYYYVELRIKDTELRHIVSRVSTGGRSGEPIPGARQSKGQRQKGKRYPDTIFIPGYAKLPDGITAREIFSVVGIGLEIDGEMGVIVAADCTLATDVARRFFSKIVEGKKLIEDFEHMVKEVETRYHGNAQKSLISALRIARDKYMVYREKISQ